MSSDTHSAVSTHTESAGDLIQVAYRIEITTQTDADEAAQLLTGLTALERSIKSAHDPVVAAAKSAHTAAIAARAEALRQVTAATTHLRAAMAAYQRHVEAEYRREMERCRLEAEAEAERLRAEAQADAERLRAEEMERRRLEAEALRKLNANEIADRIESAPVAEIIPDPVPVPQPKYVPPPPKSEGIQFRTTRRPEVVSLMELCAAIGRGDAPDYLVKADMAQIGSWLRSSRGDLPGVRMVEKTQTVVRR
ncbi:MAG: hypothetical protein MOGMAGMI_02366 [Candidatus Omnitrophica bacterium]|nr:hypothetical protein [Candidatus Omnitrophota bacterium]